MGGFSLARRPSSRTSPRPASAPSAVRRSSAQPAPSRRSASCSTTCASKALWSGIGGGWLRASVLGGEAVADMRGLLVGHGSKAEGGEGGDEPVLVRGFAGGAEGADQRLTDGADQRRGGQLDVLVGQLAALHALAQQVG